MGGLTVALVALPLALAFGISTGAGPAAGLYASIFAGFVASLFGGSEFNVSGPTGTMLVVLTMTVSQYGLEGMVLAVAIAGILQVVTALLRLGVFVKFLPHAVISGFTNGVAILIFLSQVEAGLQAPIVTLVTIGVILLAHRYARRTIPASLYGLVAGVTVNELLVRTPHVVGPIPTTLPKLALPFAAVDQIQHLVMPALTIFLLGTIESLLSAEIADVMTGKKHDSNKELLGQGLANLTASLIGALPVAGVIARTAVNARSGAKSRLAGMLHSLILLLVVLVFGRWAQRIPLAALAGILMVTAFRAADLRGFELLPRARWTYGATFLLTLVLTVVQDLAMAVAGGLALAAVFAVAELASPQLRAASGRALTAGMERWSHPEVQVAKLHGPLFFVGVERIRRELAKVPVTRILVLDFSAVSAIDESGALMLKRLAFDLQMEGRSLYIAGLGRMPLRMLARLGVLEAIGRRRVSFSVEAALRRAYEEATATPPLSGAVENDVS